MNAESALAFPNQLLPRWIPSIRGGEFWEFDVEGGGVVARPDVQGLFLLNSTALAIWHQLRRGALPEATAGKLASAFGISFDVALRDVRAAVRDWQQGLLADAPPALSSRPTGVPSAGHEIAFDCHLQDTSFRIFLSSSDLADEILPRLESLRVPALDSPDVTFRLVHVENRVYICRDGELVSVEDHPTFARIVLLNEIVRLSGSSRDFLAILHAGACGSASNCLIFPAATHSGKTTLAAILMASGLMLYADDSVALQREDLKVPAMPFALMVRQGSWPIISARFPAFRNLPIYNRYGETVKFLQPGRQVANSVAQGCAVVFSQWEADAKTRSKSLTTFDALVRLKDSGFWLAHDRDSIKNFLAWLQQLPVFELVYSDVDDAVIFLKDVLKKEGRAAVDYLPC